MSDWHDVGTLALRVGLGATIAAHGAQKLFGWFGGHGLDGTAAFFESQGFRPGKANAALAGATEIGGGVLLAAGFATPAAGAVLAGTLAVAATTATPNGFFAVDGGYEYPAFLALTAGAIATSGPGRHSLDHLTGHRLNRPWMRGVALGAIPVAVGAVLTTRHAHLAASTPDG